MMRPCTPALFALIALASGSVGCVDFWETARSHRFKDDPYGTIFGKQQEPLEVLRTNPDSDERARAMARLKEPLRDGKTETEQNEALQILSSAASVDTSPWVRLSAIDALGRFQDPRAVAILVQAYQNATGKTTPEPISPGSKVMQVGLDGKLRNDKAGLLGPQGFTLDQITMIRGRAIDSMAKIGRPESVQYLGDIAEGRTKLVNDDPTSEIFVRQRAIAALGKIRSKESVVVLAQVLANEKDKDFALTTLAHGELVDLTGKNLPPDPAAWNEVIRTGYEVVPEKNMIQKAIARE